MYQFAYISTFGLHLKSGDVDEILEKSRRNNRRDGLTGLLVADGLRFLQVLEGEEEQVATTFARIKADPRHFAVVPIYKQAISNRDFEIWDMAYRQVEKVADGISLARDVESLIPQLPAGEVRTLLKSFPQSGSPRI